MDMIHLHNVVYQAHFSRPISPDHTCQHYFGSAMDLVKRVRIHRERPDARLMQVAKERDISFQIVRTWQVPDGESLRAAERKIKNQKNGPRLCPICNGGKK